MKKRQNPINKINKPSNTWLKWSKSITNKTDPKTQQLNVMQSSANSHNWFQRNKKPKKTQNNIPIKPKTKNLNNKQHKKKLQNKPLTNKKQVLINKLNKSKKYQ